MSTNGKEIESQLRIELVSVHVLRIGIDEDEELIQDGVEVTLQIPPWSGPVGLKDWDFKADSIETNDYWEEFPKVMEIALKENSGIWQQMFWKVEGSFLIPSDLTILQAANQILFRLDINHNFSDEQLEIDDDQYIKVLSVEEIK
jgi:hypothetical protein